MTTVCPTDIVEAPLSLVWDLLTDPGNWGDFFDIRIGRVDPPGRARVGQRCQGYSGPRFLRLQVNFEFTKIDVTRHELGLDVRLPLGVRVSEDLHCTPIDVSRCRVSYGCGFGFPAGARGLLARAIMGREVRLGPIDSLSRLKRAAETIHARSGR